MVSPQQPPMGPPPGAYGYPAAAPMMMVIEKRLVFIIILIGLFFIWIAALGTRVFDFADPGLQAAMNALYFTGTLIGVAGCLLGALGSKKTDGWQNLGLFILASFFLLTATLAGIA